MPDHAKNRQPTSLWIASFQNETEGTKKRESVRRRENAGDTGEVEDNQICKKGKTIGGASVGGFAAC